MYETIETAAAVDSTQERDNVYLYAGDSEKDDTFSWQDCDCCGTSLGGSRHHVVGLNRDNHRLPVTEYMVCTDCLMEVAA